jgi:glycosyltransferase involved in cell wall biosynthesis
LPRSIVISANSLWNIANFRGGLLRALAAEGSVIVVAAPRDGSVSLPSGMRIKFTNLAVDRSGMNPFKDALLVATYYRLFRAVRPVAFLSFTIKPNIYGALAARLAGVPAIANVSGLGTAFICDNMFTTFISGLYRLAFAKSHTVFFQNPDDQDLFLERRIVGEGVCKLLPGSGIDLGRFKPAKRLDDGAPVFLFIGRLLGDKGVREFIQAAAYLKTRYPEAKFQLLGGLDPRNPTGISAAELSQSVEAGFIEYLGSADDVRPHIEEASAIVLPSYREGLPRSLLEGAAMARPLIASDVPGCREIVKDRVTGLLCRPRSSSSLAEAMAHFADMDVDQRRVLGNAARAKVEAEYDEQFVVDAYLEVLKPLWGFQAS